MINFPVVLFVYKRPKETETVLKKIIAHNSGFLYIYADGSKNGNDARGVEKTRKIVNKLALNNDKIRIVYRDKNYGLKSNIVNGISEVLLKHKAAIILEDDCVPSLEFFKFCNWALNKYRNDKEIFTVCGTKLPHKKSNGMVLRSKYFLPWGWALWRRTWKKYQNKCNNQQAQNFKLKEIPVTLRWYLEEVEKLVDNNKINTWDYKMIITQIINSKYSIVPNINLVKNIGFGSQSSNTIAGNIVNSLEIGEKDIRIGIDDNIKYSNDYDNLIVRSIFLTPVSVGGLLVRKYMPGLLKIVYK